MFIKISLSNVTFYHTEPDTNTFQTTMAKYLKSAVTNTANVASKSKIATGAIYGALRVGQSARLLTGFALGTSENIIKITLGEEKYNEFLLAAECGENAAWYYLLGMFAINFNILLFGR